jgi:hypothetical protein
MWSEKDARRAKLRAPPDWPIYTALRQLHMLACINAAFYRRSDPDEASAWQARAERTAERIRSLDPFRTVPVPIREFDLERNEAHGRTLARQGLAWWNDGEEPIAED